MPQTNYDATTAVSLQLNADQDGPRIKDELDGAMSSRDANDTAYAIFRVATPVGANDAATKDYVDTGASGITAEQHKALRQLIHFIDSGPAEGFASGAYLEILPAADPFPTSEIWWESGAKLEKIVSLDITYNANKTVNTETWKVYDTDGTTLLATVTDTYAYSGVFVTSVTRTIA